MYNTIVIGDNMNVIEAASVKWPEVFTDKWLTKAKKQVDCDNSVLARKYVLKTAQELCNKCEDCNLCTHRYGGAVFNDGGIDANIFIVGEGPGQWEQRTLLPFTYSREFKVSRCNVNCPNMSLCFPEEVIRQSRQLPNIGCEYASLAKLSVEEVKLRMRTPLKYKPNTVSVHLDTVVTELFWRDSWNIGMKIAGKESKPSDLYITNIIKCRSYDESKSKDAPPPIKCRKACRKWLDIQLFMVRPKVLIILGGVAGASIIDPEFKISSNAGSFVSITAKEFGLPTSITNVGYAFHPSAIERCPGERDRLEKVAQLRYILTEAKKINGS